MSADRVKAFDDRRVEVTANGDVVRAPRWARWKDAVTAWRPDLGARVATGEIRLTDVRGEPVDPDGRVVDGGALQVERKENDTE
ncbi:MAG: hypothetical protein R3326_07775 [Gemmatimonadota bacterium]|nr:hypothetical protein [Gemmatimonadota bacterium]